MAESAAGPTAFYRSIRQVGSGLFAAFQERFELICIELQEEKFRIIQALILINAVVFCGSMAVLFVCISIVYAFPPAMRLRVLCCISAFYILCCAGMVLALIRNLKQQRKVLPETRRELAADRSCIQPRS